MSGTILGVPVVDGRAVTPLGVVRERDSFGERYYDWYPLGDAGVVAFCDPPEADRVLRALWDAARAEPLAEVVDLTAIATRAREALPVVSEAERRGRVAGLREAETLARESADDCGQRATRWELRGVPDLAEAKAAQEREIRCLARAIADRADAIERGEP